MNELGLLEALNVDPRPSFVAELGTASAKDQLLVAFSNTALQENSAILDAILSDNAESANLRRRIGDDGHETSFTQSHQGTEWLAYTVGKRWRVVQTTRLPWKPPTQDELMQQSGTVARPYPSKNRKTDSGVVSHIFGLTEEVVGGTSGLKEHIEHISSVDWTASAIGAISGWPEDLRQLVHVMLLDPEPRAIFLTPEKLALYNLAYSKIPGVNHPAMLGKSMNQAWPAATDLYGRVFAEVDRTGNSCIWKKSYPEENTLPEGFPYTLSAIPLKNPLNGYYVTAWGETKEDVAQKRRHTLMTLFEACAGTREMMTFWKCVLETLLVNKDDFPLAFLYSTNSALATTEKPGSLISSDERQICYLEGKSGKFHNRFKLPETIDLTAADHDILSHCLVAGFREAQNTGSLAPLHGIDKLVPGPEDAIKSPCKDAVVCSIRSSADADILGFIVVGTHRPYGEEDQTFLNQLSKIVGDLARLTMIAERKTHSDKQAAAYHENENEVLTKKLATIDSKNVDINARLQRMLQITELTDVAVYDFHPSGKLLQANAAYYTMTGHPRENYGDMSFVECVHPEDLPMVLEQWDILQKGLPSTFELRWKSQMDFSTDPPSMTKPKWALCAVVPVVDGLGNVTSISGCMTDICAQKRSQEDAIERAEALERAKASEERFARFAEFAPVAMYITDLDFNITYCNAEWFKHLGHPRTAYANIDWNHLLFEEDVPAVTSAAKKLIETREKVTFEFKIKKTWTSEDGVTGPSWCFASICPDLNEDGTIMSIMGMLIDISHLKWAEKTQAVRVEQANEARRQQENFIDMTSHEIRNPLGAVVHCADSVTSSLTEMTSLVNDVSSRLTDQERGRLQDAIESSFDAVNTIMSCSTHQRRIVDDILTLSKLDSSLLTITPSLIEVDSILHDILKLFEVDAEKAGVQFVVAREESLSQVAKNVMLDLGRLMQVLINLVTNAIKFTQQESDPKVTVSMGASSTRPSKSESSVDPIPASTIRDTIDHDSEWGSGEFVYLYFKVQDTGCGLAPSEMAKIFLRFSQGSPRTHTKYGGSGLGLFISRELTEMQGGEIGVASEPGVGSTFAFFVKAFVKTDAASAAKPDTSSTVSRTHPYTSPRLPNSKYSILVVEDNIVNQNVLSKQLRKLGHEVHVASHGVEALEFIRTSKYWKGIGSVGADLNIILMDVEMPVMDGITCAKHIRDMQRTGEVRGHIPIIAVSANARREQIEQTMAAGMDDAIPKPFRIVDLIPKITRLVT